MADYDAQEQETPQSAEQAAVYHAPFLEEAEADKLRLRISQMFRRTYLPVTNTNDVVVAKAEVMECRICAALVQRSAGAMLTHARRHEAERSR